MSLSLFVLVCVLYALTTAAYWREFLDLRRAPHRPAHILLILTFLAQDADSQVFCYSNADIRKGDEAEEVFRFLDFWAAHHGKKLPGELVFDSKLTTHAGLARLDAMGVPFITLRGTRGGSSVAVAILNALLLISVNE